VSTSVSRSSDAPISSTMKRSHPPPAPRPRSSSQTRGSAAS
jgi:hypothetical protein